MNIGQNCLVKKISKQDCNIIMRKDLYQIDAKTILGQIRRRKRSVALFATETGYRMFDSTRISDSMLAKDGFIGIYDKNASWQRIQDDWNDTI